MEVNKFVVVDPIEVIKGAYNPDAGAFPDWVWVLCTNLHALVGVVHLPGSTLTPLFNLCATR